MPTKLSLILVLPFAVLSASLSTSVSADAVRGKTLYENRCIGCHSVEENRVGPKHRGVVGRKAGSVKDYDYSSALKASKIVWDVALLQRWLTNPEALIPGQRPRCFASSSFSRKVSGSDMSSLPFSMVPPPLIHKDILRYITISRYIDRGGSFC